MPEWSLLLLIATVVIWIGGLVVVALAQIKADRRLCATIETQLAQGDVVRDMQAASTLHNDVLKSLSSRVEGLERWRNGLPAPPPPDPLPANHRHSPYTYHAEQLVDQIAEGIGSNGQMVYKAKVVGVLDHHACRLCSKVLD